MKTNIKYTSLCLYIIFILGAFNSNILHSEDKTGRRYLSVSDPVYLEVKGIYDRIVHAVFTKKNTPALRMPLDSVQPAQITDFKKPVPTIEFELKAYKILKKLPDYKAAIAFMLAHELAHYYRLHVDKVNQGIVLDKLKYPHRKMDEFSQKWVQDKLMPMEYEADKFAAVYSYIAGYDIRSVQKAAIKNIYSGYQLKDSALQKAGYLPELKRQQVADSVASWLLDYIPYFDAGNYLYLIQSYADAADCFEKICKIYPSKDIFNNLGVCYAQRAFAIAGEPYNKYCFPFSFEEKSGIETALKTPFEDTLRLARECFENALGLDSTYTMARVNLACVLIMQDSSGKAIELLDKIDRKDADTYSLANIDIALGIAYAVSGDTPTAEKLFLAAKKGNPGFASFNLSALNPMKYKFHTPEELPLLTSIIDNERICKTGIYDDGEKISGKVSLNDNFLYYQNPTCSAVSLWKHQGALKNKTMRMKIRNDYYFISATNEYRDSSFKGARIGDRFDGMNKYGKFKYIMQSDDYNYYVFDDEIKDAIPAAPSKKGIIFKVGKKSEKIEGWTIFELQYH